MKKITIVTDNRIGILAEVTELMGAADINIEDIRADSYGDFGVIHLRVDKYDEALKSFLSQGLPAYTEEIFLLKIEDRPGALAKIAKRFKDQGIDVQSIRIVRRAQGLGIAALVCDKMEEARKVASDLLL